MYISGPYDDAERIMRKMGRSAVTSAVAAIGAI
jgi:hypothetical protein